MVAAFKGQSPSGVVKECYSFVAMHMSRFFNSPILNFYVF